MAESNSLALKIRRLLSLDSADRRPLKLLGPTFALTAALNIVLSSVSKALFLSTHELDVLPAMFLASAAFTALASLSFIAASNRLSLGARFQILLAIAGVSFLGIQLAFPLAPGVMSVVVFVWTPAIGQLITFQTWNLASLLLPTRQSKRLFPVLAAIATAGAAAGGGLVKVLLAWIETEQLLGLAVLLTIWPMIALRRSIRALSTSAPAEAPKPSTKGESASDALLGGIQGILSSPLLVRLALFVFFMQGASVLIDYQFSGELKANFDRSHIASFLGSFYLLSNLTVVVLSLFVTSRVVRVLGIGLAISAGAIFLAVGSTAALVVAAGGFTAFWAISGTAFAMSVSQYALTRNSMQVLVTPLDTRLGERARTLIDGVVYRMATIMASLGLLLFAPGVEHLHLLSPFVILAAGVVLVMGLRIAPHYRNALFEALHSKRLDPALSSLLSHGLGSRATRMVEDHLGSDDPKLVNRALSVTRELGLTVRPELLEALILFGDEKTASRALEALRRQEGGASQELFGRILSSNRPPRVIRAVLHIITEEQDASFAEKVAPLTKHKDATVASMASLYRVRVERGDEELEKVLARPMEAKTIMVSRTTRLRAADFMAELLESLEHGTTEERIEAIAAIGRLRLPTCVDALIVALAERSLREAATTALVAYGDLFIDHARARFAAPDLELRTHASLIQALAHLPRRESVEILEAQFAEGPAIMREEALLALWRMARNPEASRPDVAWLQARAAEEIQVIQRCVAIESFVMPISRRVIFFLGEVGAARAQREARVFRLLGLLYDRAAIYQAYHNYQSSVARVRSNAIELLDQHVTHPELKAFVGLVERNKDADGGENLRTQVVRRVRSDLSEEEIRQIGDAWLERVWRWTEEPDAARPDYANDEIERVRVLKRSDTFSRISGVQLLPLAEASTLRSLSSGELLFNQGDHGDYLCLILEGEIDIVRDGKRIARLGAEEVLGELSLLDDSERSASAMAHGATQLLIIGRGTFNNLVDILPTLTHSILGVLAQRIRSMLEAYAPEAKNPTEKPR